MKQVYRSVITLAALLSLSGCYVEEAGSDDASRTALARKGPKEKIPAPSPTPTPTPTPTPAPNLVAVLSEQGVMELPKVASGVNLADPALTYTSSLAKSAAPDVVGAFRFNCRPSHLAYADPIVFPGQNGMAHLHVLFGNTLTDADSTYESLRKTGDSTCFNALNRSAYWVPALLQKLASGVEQVVMPDHFTVYYKRRPADDAYYAGTGNTPVRTPRGLRFLFGWPNYAGVNFSCALVKSRDMATALAACKEGDTFRANLFTPACWNGKDLDSPDHRSHMSYEIRDASTNWKVQCPATHPYVIPTYTLSANYQILPGDQPLTFEWSSAMMNPGGRQGETFHADWFGAWEDDILKAWDEHCINKLLNCSFGSLGNGTYLRMNSISENANPMTNARLPVPAPPTPHHH